MIEKSIHHFIEAQSVLPGGVDSPVRAFRAVGGQPLFIDCGQGPYLQDVDGNRYIDYVLSWGPLILGHAHPEVVRAVKLAADRGTSYGAPSPLETRLARRVQEFMPDLEMLRFVNSGTEATMTAIRLARAYTGKNKIIKFEGCYHGHADLLLVQAGSGVATLGLPDSPGVPEATVSDTLVARFNDLGSVEMLFEEFWDQIAAVIIEPVAGNMGVVPPLPGFLEGLRQLTCDFGALLIFDEVMTGFRVHPGGAQALYGVKPDLTTLGKVIGGGLPVGAYGGRQEIMQMIAPSGPVYQAGTLSGNPLAMSAGLATLEVLQTPGLWEHIETQTTRLFAGLGERAQSAGIPLVGNRVGTMFSAFFTDQVVQDWPTAGTSDTGRFAAFFNGMLERGIYLAPSQFEAGFVSSAHDDEAIEITLEAAEAVFATL
ncbi:MAG: glutamate-1-semialdehyde 2,1-aminomutase [Anaerolineales bacterium]|nr:glutamate-1-semialdehyde 2,1-aminomutase [Anaerolineales bacterium]